MHVIKNGLLSSQLIRKNDFDEKRLNWREEKRAWLINWRQELIRRKRRRLEGSMGRRRRRGRHLSLSQYITQQKALLKCSIRQSWIDHHDHQDHQNYHEDGHQSSLVHPVLLISSPFFFEAGERKREREEIIIQLSDVFLAIVQIRFGMKWSWSEWVSCWISLFSSREVCLVRGEEMDREKRIKIQRRLLEWDGDSKLILNQKQNYLLYYSGFLGGRKRRDTQWKDDEDEGDIHLMPID